MSGKKSYKELVTEDGSVKSVRREGDKLIDTATLGPKKGKQMLVISGQHQGLQCIVQTVVEDVSDGAQPPRFRSMLALPCTAHGPGPSYTVTSYTVVYSKYHYRHAGNKMNSSM